MVDSSSPSRLQHRQVQVANHSIHVVEGGSPGRSCMVFLHGWPESWFLYERVMLRLSDQCHVVAIDLPGIGQSSGVAEGYDTRSLAHFVHQLMAELGLTDVTLVGHDLGGMIAYTYLHAYPEELRSAVILNTVIPGVDPWDEIFATAGIWHFHFHQVPGLPELLVDGHAAEYFSYFYETLAGPAGVSPRARRAFAEAYATQAALHTGFEWYRALEVNARDNASMKEHLVSTPVLYVRGEKERGDMATYLEGLQAGGLQNVEQAVIAGSGHFTPDEQPDALADVLLQFVTARENITA